MWQKDSIAFCYGLVANKIYSNDGPVYRRKFVVPGSCSNINIAFPGMGFSL